MGYPLPVRFRSLDFHREPLGRSDPTRELVRSGFGVLVLCGVLATAGLAAEGVPRLAAPSGDRGKLDPAIQRLLPAGADETVIAWVYFTDRAGAERSLEASHRASPLVSDRSLDRRLRRGAVNGLLASDLPVHDPYLRALTRRGARLRGTSRWLNAASAELPARLAAELTHLPFVARIDLVPWAAPMSPVGDPEPVPPGLLGGEDRAARAVPTAAAIAPGDTAYYGGSFRQLSMMQVPQLHAMGLSGAGVLVCMLDTGFRTTHQVYSGLDIVATRDFVFGDTNVDDEAGQDSAGQAAHGTVTLACVAGSKPGTYMGVAPGVSVALAKTEWVPTERPVEMDYWQFAAEWADSLGADVISSSLGYSQFDSPFPSYTYADMDGRTTVVARAAAEAARRGITVVNSAGNSGASSWHYIISPADADSIIAVGAVDSFNVVTSFSSRGPSSDGRIKPDVVAMGLRVLVSSFSNDSTYQRVSGTSFSAPLTAGVAALLLEAHPGWRPYEVREALRETALNQASPDTVIGWGLVQGAAAKNWIPSTVGVPRADASPNLRVAAGPNPVRAGEGLAIRFAAPSGERVVLEVLDLEGRRRASLFEGSAAGGRTVSWNGRDKHGATLAAGIYWVRMRGEESGSCALRIALVR